MFETIRHLGEGAHGSADLVRLTGVLPDAGLLSSAKNTWLINPIEGQELVKKELVKKRGRWGRKYTDSSKNLETEREVLLSLQPHFEDDESRPVRLLGYGWRSGPLRHRMPYLLLEPICSPFVSLSFLVGKSRILPLNETLSFTREVSGVLMRSHKVFGAHGNLYEDHIFINRSTGKVRIIDWGSAAAGRYESDIRAMGEMIFRALRGHSTFESTQKKEELDTMPALLKNIIRKSRCFLHDPYDSPIEYYPLTPEGMEELHKDLNDIKV